MIDTIRSLLLISVVIGGLFIVTVSINLSY